VLAFGNPIKYEKLMCSVRVPVERCLFKPEKLSALVCIIGKFYFIAVAFLLGQLRQAIKLQGILINFVAVGLLAFFYSEAVIFFVIVFHSEANRIAGPHQRWDKKNEKKNFHAATFLHKFRRWVTRNSMPVQACCTIKTSRKSGRVAECT
jgi:hypothetical protein